MPLKAITTLQVGKEAKLFTQMIYKNDTFQLFGFLTVTEKDLFNSICTVSGIGPKTGIAILSHFDTEEFTNIIYNEDVFRFTSVPGIGKKTAERLMFELKYKIEKIADNQAFQPDRTDKASIKYLTESALINLGYSTMEAKKAVSALSGEKIENLEDAVRFCLKRMAKSR